MEEEFKVTMFGKNPGSKSTGVGALKKLSISCVLAIRSSFMTRRSTQYPVYFLSFRDLLSKTIVQSALRFCTGHKISY